MSTSQKEWITTIETALKLDWPYTGRRGGSVRLPPRPADEKSVAAAVLVTLGFSSASPEEPQLLLTVRSQQVESHKGQISFLGGVVDDGETIDEAALREAEEELGLSRKQIRLLGKLPELPTLTTGFRIHPVVGVMTVALEKITFQPQPNEVEEAFWVPLEKLILPESRKMEKYRVGAVDYPTPAFYWGGHRIWGATAAIIWNLLERVEELEKF